MPACAEIGKCEWLVWAVNHPRPHLLTVSDDDDDDNADWMMMMMMKIVFVDSDATESVAILRLFAFLIMLVIFERSDVNVSFLLLLLFFVIVKRTNKVIYHQSTVHANLFTVFPPTLKSVKLPK